MNYNDHSSNSTWVEENELLQRLGVTNRVQNGEIENRKIQSLLVIINTNLYKIINLDNYE